MMLLPAFSSIIRRLLLGSESVSLYFSSFTVKWLLQARQKAPSSTGEMGVSIGPILLPQEVPLRYEISEMPEHTHLSSRTSGRAQVTRIVDACICTRVDAHT